MRTLCSLLLIGCLLFSYATPVAGILGPLRIQTDYHRCLREKGFCLNAVCPRSTLFVGTCFPYKFYCCKFKR
ncbi:beta-defensin 2 precursor [Rattus norvegicus]|uniref:Beta-defensin 2 n=1 Tax=Rattus norvegicus TaxID=10116 RepID=Q32ZI5_RAT|nr:beta-defensin 2 precursor [Rattus norvegicus]AAT51877.1 beta-defensin 2 [Rattus norvegicus]|eukprot:NP_001032596.1 beta-defensin 2 precursor [Rattus norvegicus]